MITADQRPPSISENTARAYRADWADFSTWASGRGVAALPAEGDELVRYVADLAARGRKPSTIRRRLSSIAHIHRAAGLPSPTGERGVQDAVRALSGAVGSGQPDKTPLLTADLRSLVAGLPETHRGIRDRALLLLGFAGAFRRGELVGIDAEDIEEHGFGLRIRIRCSRAADARPGRTVDIPFGSHQATCPVRAVTAWREAADIVSGPLFRGVSKAGRTRPGRLSDKSVVLVLKRAVRAAGLDPCRYAGHSLRAGLAVAAAAAGASERSIRAQTGYRSTRTIRRYAAAAAVLENAAFVAGL